MDYEYVIAIIAGVIGIIALVITTVCKYYGEKSIAEEDKKTVDANPDKCFVRENVFNGGKTRHGICQHYHQLLYQNIAKLMQNIDPNNPSRNKAYTHPLRMEMCHTALVFKRNVMEFLDADMKKYLEGETLQRCIRINVHFEASKNFYNLSVNKPESNLLRYSKFFNDLFYVCQMINLSVKERNAESPEILAIANDIDALIAEYKPIAQIFEESKQNTGKVIDKINERWGDKITKVASMKDVSEKTLYIIFEDMLFYIEKYYTYMDDIRDITIRRMAGI